MEATLFHKKRRRLLSAWRPMGRDAPDMAGVPGRARHRLVGGFLPERQYATAHGSAVRRLPLRELQHRDKDGDGMERRLRKVSRPRRGARSASVTRKYC